MIEMINGESRIKVSPAKLDTMLSRGWKIAEANKTQAQQPEIETLDDENEDEIDG